jgi:SAM-dependent methyltransferase
MRRHAPATQRNRGPILEVLRAVLPPAGTVLEVASGSGEHAVHFAAALPALTFQPSDVDPDAVASIRAWIDATGLTNVRPPLHFDVTDHPWPTEPVQAIFSANLVHIAPAAAAEALVAGAARHLVPGGLLVMYGPFRVGGAHTAPSNAAFDADLRARDPRWGVRDMEWVRDLAGHAGLELEQQLQLPANNQILVFRRKTPPAVK